MDNVISVIVIAVILAAFVAVIAMRIVNKKKGKSSCSCGKAALSPKKKLPKWRSW